MLQQRNHTKHNKRMQTDIFSRYAPENAADAGRYATSRGNSR